MVTIGLISFLISYSLKQKFLSISMLFSASIMTIIIMSIISTTDNGSFILIYWSLKFYNPAQKIFDLAMRGLLVYFSEYYLEI
jgi:hypothetical protein